MKNTPGLDRLTEEVQPLLFQNLRLRATTESRETQLVQWFEATYAGHLGKIIRRLFILEQEQLRSCSTRTGIFQSVKDEFELSQGQLASLLRFLGLVRDLCYRVLEQKMGTYREIDIAQILIELYHVDEKTFGFHDPEEAALDFNHHDTFPSGADDPNYYLASLIRDVVVARITKRYGPDLLRIWVETPRSACEE